MEVLITAGEARRLVNNLLNAPIAPGKYSHFINVGTDHILNALDQNYFRGQLADGIGCFKYLRGRLRKWQNPVYKQLGEQSERTRCGHSYRDRRCRLPL